MPSTSPKQHRFMEAVKHSPSFAKKVGVPQSVGRDFAKADDKAGITKNPSSSPRSPAEHMARQKQSGATYSTIAHEHGTSKSTAHRRVKQDTLRQGFNRLGGAG